MPGPLLSFYSYFSLSNFIKFSFQDNGGDQEELQCGSGAQSGALSTGEAGTAGAGRTCGGTATAADDGAGREAEEGEAGL